MLDRLRHADLGWRRKLQARLPGRMGRAMARGTALHEAVWDYVAGVRHAAAAATKLHGPTTIADRLGKDPK